MGMFSTDGESVAKERFEEALKAALTLREWAGKLIDAIEKRKEGNCVDANWLNMIQRQLTTAYNEIGRGNGAMLARVDMSNAEADGQKAGDWICTCLYRNTRPVCTKCGNPKATKQKAGE